MPASRTAFASFSDYVVDVKAPHANAHVFHTGQWLAALFLAAAVLPWLAGMSVWLTLGHAREVNDSVSGFLMVSSLWNYFIASLIPPVALMLVEKTRTGPITWYRLRDDERQLFAQTMFGTVCLLTVLLFGLVWREHRGAIIPVMMTSFLPAMVATLSGVLLGTIVVAGRHLWQRRKTGPAAT
jgi:hypothetical protein